MRIFSILMLLASIVIDARIVLPYLIRLFGSGEFTASSISIPATHTLSATLQLVAIVLLISNKQGRLLFSIAVAIIGIVIFNHVYQPSADGNLLATAGALTIFASMFSADLARLNPNKQRSEIIKTQFFYAVLPTILILSSPVLIFHNDIITTINEHLAKRTYGDRLADKQKAYSFNLRERHQSSASGRIKGDIHTLPIKDSLTIYDTYNRILTIHLFPSPLSWDDKQSILGGEAPFFLLVRKASPDSKKWAQYPYASLTLKLREQGVFSSDNIELFAIHAHSVDMTGYSRSSSTDQDMENWFLLFEKVGKDGGEWLSLRLDTVNSEMTGAELDIADKIHRY